MRVIGGAWKGRALQAPPGQHTRPLTDRIKQSLFDWLGQRFDDWSVIDICAGSGGFGIEAASRGATKVHLIECERNAQQTIQRNFNKVGNPTSLRLHNGTFQQVLPRLNPVDLIFADPPFPWFQQDPEALVCLLQDARPKCAGQLIIRGERGTHLPPLPAGWELEERREYGRSWVQRILPM